MTAYGFISRPAAIAAVLLLLLSSAHAQRNSLDARVKAELASFKGKVSMFARNLDTGETYALAADDRVRAAPGLHGRTPGWRADNRRTSYR